MRNRYGHMAGMSLPRITPTLAGPDGPEEREAEAREVAERARRDTERREAEADDWVQDLYDQL